GEGRGDDAWFERGGRRVEDLALRDGRCAAVVLQQRFHVGRCWNFRAVRIFRRDEQAQRAVRGFQVAQGRGLHVRRRDFLQPVAVPEQKAPVAHACVFGEDAGERGRVGQRQVDLVQQTRARAGDFVVGRGIARESFQYAEQRVARGIEGGILLDVRAEIRESRFALLALAAEDRARE